MKYERTMPLKDAARILAMSIAREHYPELIGRPVKAKTTLINNSDGLVSDVRIEFEAPETALDG